MEEKDVPPIAILHALLKAPFPTSPTIQVLLTMASYFILLWLLALPLHLACGEAKASQVQTFWVRDLLPDSICSASPKGELLAT